MKKTVILNGSNGNKKAYLNKVHKARKPERIIGKDLKITADERSLSNLNTLVIGATGAGKTRGYVSPNISASTVESMVVIDSKLNLYHKHKDELEAKGYRVELIDLVNLDNSSIGYNPLDFVRTCGEHGIAKPDDVKELAEFIVSDERFHSDRDPLWENAARQYVVACLSLCFHILPDEEHTLTTVSKLLSYMDQPAWDTFIQKAEQDDPECLEVIIDREIREGRVTEKMHASIVNIAKIALNHFTWDEANKLYTMPQRIRFADLGDSKMAFFINVSDHDYSKTPLVTMFFSQCIKELLDHADRQKSCRLRVPVHLYCDDIGATFVIPHLPELMSITRSRRISLSLIMQSWSQLLKKYGQYDASTIAGNSSVIVYLGSSELESPKFLSEKANIPLDKLTGMKSDTQFVCIHGQKPFFCKKYIKDDLKEVVFDTEKALEPQDEKEAG